MMKQNVYSKDDDVPIDVFISTNDIPSDENSIHNIDPLIQPLFDPDELKVKENDEKQFDNLEKNSSLILTHQIKKPNSSPQGFRRCAGIFYAILGSSLFTCSGFIVKQLRVDFFDALLFRFIIQSLILLTFVLYKRYKLINGSFSLISIQIIRVLCGASGFILFYTSYRYIPLPDLTTFRYTQVIWTAILAMLIFRERISIPTVIAIILTLIGVVCVAQPTFLFPNYRILSNRTEISSNTTGILNKKLNDVDLESDKSYRYLGLCLALACALSISASIVLNKKLLVLKIPQSILMLQHSLLCFIILFIYHLRQRFILHAYSNQTMFTWQFILASAILSTQLFSSAFTQKAIKLEHPSIISVVQSSDILIAIILQNLFANVKSNWLVLLGSALVTTSIFLVGIHKLWKEQKKSSEETNNSKV